MFLEKLEAVKASFASHRDADAFSRRGRLRLPACAVLRRARWHVKASEARIGVRRRAQPSYVLPSTTHAGATLPSPVAPACGAPNAPPLSPRDDDVDDLTFAAQDGFKSTATARDSPDVVCRDRDAIEVLATA